MTRRQERNRTLQIWSRRLGCCLRAHLALPLIIKPMNSCRLLGLIERAEFSPDSHICIINYLLERCERQRAVSLIWIVSAEPRTLCVVSGISCFCNPTPQCELLCLKLVLSVLSVSNFLLLLRTDLFKFFPYLRGID